VVRGEPVGGSEEESGGDDLPALVAYELNVLNDEQVEKCIAELKK